MRPPASYGLEPRWTTKRGPNSYIVTVDATDPSGLYDTIEVTITVGNVDEPGTVTLSGTQPLVAFPLTATLDDPDEVSGSVTWSWERSQNGTPSWILISGATAATYNPDAAAEGRFLRATASYDDVESAGKIARAVSVNPVRTLKPDNMDPQFPQSETRARSVTETRRRTRASARRSRPRTRIAATRSPTPWAAATRPPSTSIKTPASCRPRPPWTLKRPLLTP